MGAGENATKAAMDQFREVWGEMDQLCRERKQALAVDFTHLLDQAALDAVEGGQPEENYLTFALEAATRALRALIDAMAALPTELPGEDARAARAIREFELLEVPGGKTN